MSETGFQSSQAGIKIPSFSPLLQTLQQDFQAMVLLLEGDRSIVKCLSSLGSALSLSLSRSPWQITLSSPNWPTSLAHLWLSLELGQFSVLKWVVSSLDGDQGQKRRKQVVLPHAEKEGIFFPYNFVLLTVKWLNLQGQDQRFFYGQNQDFYDIAHS